MQALRMAELPTRLWRRKGAILLSGLAAGSLAAGVVALLPPSYRSEGFLVIESRGGEPEGSVANRADVLQSLALLRRVVGDLRLAPSTPGLLPGLRWPAAAVPWIDAAKAAIKHLAPQGGEAGDPADALIEAMQPRLHAVAKEHSAVVSVEFRAGSPEVAAAVVNATMRQYIATDSDARKAQMAETEVALSQQAKSMRADLDAAEQRVAQFVREHNLPEVQGGAAAALLLARDQEQLAAARTDYVRQKAVLDLARNGAASGSTPEALASRTISALKSLEAQQAFRLSELSQTDPRRAAMQEALNAIRNNIKGETSLVTASLGQTVQSAQAKVQALEEAVRQDSENVSSAAAGGAALTRLKNELADKRLLYNAFLGIAQQTRINAAQAAGAHVLIAAEPDQRPVKASKALALVLGSLGGGIAAAGVVVLRNAMDNRIRSTPEMAFATGLPGLGSLPDTKSKRGDGLLTTRRNAPEIVETLRGIGLALQAPGTAIVVTSSVVGEGKTTIALALARCLADDGRRVLLIDADLRRPRLSDLLKTSSAPGLEAALRGGTLAPAHAGLEFLLTDGSTENPIAVLGSEPFRRLVQNSKRTYDLVILDSPPVLHVADATVLASLCEHVLFIVQSDRVPAEHVGEATRRFAAADRSKIITLLNRVRPEFLDRRDYYSGYASQGRSMS